jgi:hypothetical protein
VIALAFIAAALIGDAQTVVIPPSVPAPVQAPATIAPTDWTTLPDLRLIRPAPLPASLSDFVRGEVDAGRCASARHTIAGGYTLAVNLIVRIGANGTVLEVVPRAIGCPTVEQYASGIVSRMARGNVLPTAGWFRTAIVFAWPQ